MDMLQQLIDHYHSFTPLIEAERVKALALDAGKALVLHIPYALEVLHEQRARHTAKLALLRSNQADTLTALEAMGGTIE